MNTTSTFDLARDAVRQNRRAPQVLEARPMSLEASPPSGLLASKARTAQVQQQVLQPHRASLQRSLF